MSQGSFRIVKDKSTRAYKPVDGAVASAMATWLAIEYGGLSSEEPIRIESHFADTAVWQEENPLDRDLPFPLRSS